MHKFIYLTLFWLLLAPISAFAQMGAASYYTQAWVDDSWSDYPPDEPGKIYLAGSSVTQDDTNPYGHSYNTYGILYHSGGYLVAYNGGPNISWQWDGSPGTFNLVGTHTTSCPICACEWNNSSGSAFTMGPLGYTELYYKFDSVINQLGNNYYCGYTICDWSKGCSCYNFLRGSAVIIVTCGCSPPPCPIGAVVKYKITSIHIPFFGDNEFCARLGPTQGLNFDPCVAVPPWNPDCSITNDPKPFP